MRATRLWRDGRWHCECGCVSSRWIAHLYLEDVIVGESTFDSLSPMLRLAHYWHAAVRKDDTGALLVNDLDLENDRRQTTPERRSVPRGGRRGTDLRR